MADDEKNPLFSERVREQLLLRRILVLDGVLDDDNGTLLATQLLTLGVEDPAADIALWIHSPGGSYIQAPVATTCVGQAIGVGAVLLAAGTAGRRSLLPHARVVLHQPAARGQGPIPDLILQADEVVRMRADIEAILSAHTGQSAATLRTDTDRDRVLTAQAALAYGIVDQVLGQRSADSFSVTPRRWRPARPAWPPGGRASWPRPGRAPRRGPGRSPGWRRAPRCR